MESTKRIIIDAIVKEDGKLYLDFKTESNVSAPSVNELLTILSSSLVMSIKLACRDLDYEKQGKLIKDVFDYLKSDLFDGDAFKDLSIKTEEL